MHLSNRFWVATNHPANTYAYFGEPVYIYSLKEGINDGFLTPFRVKQISTTLDEYVFTPDDRVIEGEIEAGKRYTETDFNKFIEIKEREAHRVTVFMEQIDQNEKTLVFCATQDHALAVRDLVNQMKKSRDPDYCHRVTANDGELGKRLAQPTPPRFTNQPYRRAFRGRVPLAGQEHLPSLRSAHPRTRGSGWSMPITSR